ncbi:MAG: bifunctional oligoribonuclease/PAP phosphatase NrnA, partial [Deltaproteobacteria bacterium]|nr:bifunctional oligoribonuclease/PAP phosphatase NrnA [Deltaproteobacteria bacterium]
VPRFLKFLPGSEKFTQALAGNELFDLAFIVDVGQKKRLGEAFASHRGFKKIICIDHHAVGEHEGDINYVLPQASASGIAIFKLVKALGIKKIPPAIATSLYCAIATDTGSFRYANTTSETFSIAAELLNDGVDPWLVARNCFETIPLPRFELLKRVLESLKVHPDGRIASILLTEADLSACGATMDEAEGLINYARAIEGVEVGIAFRETGPQEYKVSFRSNDYVNVALIAKKFGGGGHIRASGCKVCGTLAEVQTKIFRAVKEVL